MTALLGLLAACKPSPPCAHCDTLVIAAVNEPSSLIPPLAVETVGRDIDDQLYERLADLMPAHAPTDSTGYRPGLASSWERVDSVTWRFHLRPNARWSDGPPVTAGDVVFSFTAYADSVLDALARSTIAGHITATAADSTTVLVHFDHAYAEQLYDATWNVRVLPAHIWGKIPTSDWAADTAAAHLVGSGPFKLARWTRGEVVELVPSTTGAPPVPALAHLLWRFVPDPDAALNLVLAHEADLLETLTTPERAARVEADSTLTVIAYPSAAYGFVGYHLAGNGPLSDRRVRRALNMAVDRQAIAIQLFGAGAKAPPGPISQVLWLWSDSIHTLPFDTAEAVHQLDQAGWKPGPDGVRRSGARKLAFDILVPGTSTVRRRAA
ncbi:MAG: ABC transporter substrate-binding protein, partial [Gemmatimonadota bacterium]